MCVNYILLLWKPKHLCWHCKYIFSAFSILLAYCSDLAFQVMLRERWIIHCEQDSGLSVSYKYNTCTEKLPFYRWVVIRGTDNTHIQLLVCIHWRWSCRFTVSCRPAVKCHEVMQLYNFVFRDSSRPFWNPHFVPRCIAGD